MFANLLAKQPWFEIVEQDCHWDSKIPDLETVLLEQLLEWIPNCLSTIQDSLKLEMELLWHVLFDLLDSYKDSIFPYFVKEC